ncbi:MAG: hypothetical protein CVV19_00685 [Gammaproteobacteria bacterium HGW-Gammaproteobacteria-9]|nr:MAG: hypothetical protein CVV19_00685 [Gammaproteobacteria bacterium HGW-Gammaproteobacteria-9]PKM09474.1 MAG: hypothetical protein CVV17_00680 [Gammaproteobacteria bacterium HGW-Gammaproteobacteria-7]
MADRIAVNSATRLSEAIHKLTAMYREKKYVVVSFREGKDRTLDQNALWFSLYERIAQMTNIGDVEDARSYCKLHVGVRILLRDCADYRETWDRLFLHWSYEDKLALMGAHPVAGPEGLAVTRLFNRKQGIEYTDRIVSEFTGRGVFFGDLLGEAA